MQIKVKDCLHREKDEQRKYTIRCRWLSKQSTPVSLLGYQRLLNDVLQAKQLPLWRVEFSSTLPLQKIFSAVFIYDLHHSREGGGSLWKEEKPNKFFGSPEWPLSELWLDLLLGLLGKDFSHLAAYFLLGILLYLSESSCFLSS